MKRDAAAPCQSSLNTGMAWSVISEVRTLLDRLAARGESSGIDLRSLPLTDADRTQLEDLLGKGEVYCELKLMGSTKVWETAYAGVWWVRHMGAGDKVSSEEIAVTGVPEILRAHPADISASAEMLGRELEAGAVEASRESKEAGHV
jgi:hydrogenase-1 operon protein HyaF